MVTKKIEQFENRLETRDQRGSIFGTPAAGNQGPDHHLVFSSTVNIIVSSPSIELSPRKRTIPIIQNKSDQIFNNSLPLKDYFYHAHNFLNDFEDEIQEKRKDQLKKYAKWKATKWVKKNQRIKLEKKHSEQKIVCKICARDVKTTIMKDHSSYCRKQGEIEKTLKKQDKKLADILHKAGMKAKNYHTKVILLSKSYYKLRDKFGSPSSRRLQQFRGFTVINNPVASSSSRIHSASGSPQFSLTSSHRPSPEWSRNSGSVMKSRQKIVRNLLKTYTSVVTENESHNHMNEISFADKNSQHADESFNLESSNYTNSNSPFTSPETQRRRRSQYAINSSPEDQARKISNSVLLRPAKSPLLKSDEAELLSPLSPQLNGGKGKNKGLFVVKSRKKKKKVKEGKTKVNDDVNYNFYSDPAKSENGSGNSTDSHISIESIVSTRYLQNRNRFDDSLNVSRNDSMTSLDRCPSTERSPPHLSTPQVHKKSQFARLNTMVVTTGYQDEKRNMSIEAVSEEENFENDILELNKKESDTKLSPLLLPECEKDDEGTTMQSRNVDDEMESRQGDPTLMEMIRIRTEITAKKLVKETFDFIVGKGKILLNQGVYQRSKEEYLGEVSKFF